MNTIGTMLALIVLQQVPVFGGLSNNIPAGPSAIVFSTLYQYFRLVPEAYHFRIFGVTLSDKFWVYGTALQVRLCPVALHWRKSLFSSGSYLA